MRNVIVRPRNFGIGHNIDSLLNDFFKASIEGSNGTNGCCFNPAVDIKDTADNVVLTFELPGMEKSDIKVWVEEGVLTVSGDRHIHKEDKNEEYVCSEINGGAFNLSINLPKTVDSGKISADYKNGLLVISADKLEETKPKEIKIEVL